MPLKRLTWALLGACLAALVALLWPVRPLWLWLDTFPGMVEHFSPDGQYLYSVHYTSAGYTPYLCQLDANNGTMVKKTELEGLVSTGLGKHENNIRLSRDTRTLFVGTRSPGSGDTDTWHLYDAQTGKRRSEAIMNVAHFNPEADSRNGRWFWTYHGVRGKSTMNEGLDIYSIETGKCILQLRNQQSVKPWSIHFHPASDQALVFWNSKEQSYYQLIDLPSGKELKRFTLPALPQGQRWGGGIDGWEGDAIWVEYTEPHPDKPNDPNQYLRRTKRFELNQEHLGGGISEPLFSGEVITPDGQSYWDHGDHWVVYYRLYHPREDQLPVPWLQTAREWIEKKLNLAKPFFGSKIKVRIVKRPSGEEQYVMPFPVGSPAVVSADGKRLACGTKEGGIAVYDLDPTPRWVVVLLSSAGTAGLILLLSRRRAKPSAKHVPVQPLA